MREALKKSLRRLLPERVREPQRRLLSPEHYVRVPGPPTFDADGLMSWHNCDFLADPRFRAAYAAGERTGSWGSANIAWRVHVACWAAAQAMAHEGDLVECGVNKGGLSRAVIEYVDFARAGRAFYLLDTFRGLSADHLSAAERELGFAPAMLGHYEECYDQVVETFRPFPTVAIIRGTVPETLPQVAAEKVCYLSIDMNCVEPEIAAAEFFWDRLVPGAIVVLDDYGWANHILQKRAFDAFAARRGVPLLALPTGQGLIIKP